MDATVVAVASDGDDGDRRRPLLETGNEILPYPESPSRPQPPGADAKLEQQKPQRVASLDVFRGLTVAMMILVDDAGGAWPGINHAPWFGVTVADFVMPAFLFIIGVSAALVFKFSCSCNNWRLLMLLGIIVFCWVSNYPFCCSSLMPWEWERADTKHD